MDKFLEIVYNSQFASEAEKGDKFEEHFKPFLDRMQELLSPKLYEELEEIFTDCAVASSEFYAVEGMKLAIGIMEGTYIPAF